MISDVQDRLNDLTKHTIEALEYGAENYVRHRIGSLGHRDFQGMKIVFDLRDNDYALINRDMLEEVIRDEMSKDFQDRVAIISE